MARAFGLRILFGHWQLHVGVAVVVLRRRGERKMRRHHRDEQHPGFVLILGRFVAQPDLRLRGNVAVVARVVRFTRARSADHFLGAGTHRRIGPAPQRNQITQPIDDVHRDDLFRETVVVALVAAKVQLADRHHAMPLRA